MKLLNCFLVVGTAMFLIASTLLGRGMMPSLVILKPKYSSSSFAKKDFSAFTLKPAACSFLSTLPTLSR